MRKIVSGFSQNTHQIQANQWLNQGFSVIPLLGNSAPQSPKAPAIGSWREYQTRLPRPDEITAWYATHPQRSIGIITGRISQLLVIDLDSAVTAHHFKELLPDLTSTFTVLSGNRQLPHYYFRIPDDLTVPARRTHGIELRSDGQYVVAPESVINGRTWQIARLAPMRWLTARDVERLIAFIDTCPSPPTFGIKPPRSTARDLPAAPVDSRPIEIKLTPSGLARRYTRRADLIGRNNALFESACLARDHGWTIDLVTGALINTHAHKRTTHPHAPETMDQRQREARATIASVFTRPARPVKPREGRQLPNSVREKLLALGLDSAARVLDGLLMAGYKAGQHLSPLKLYEALKSYGIGRNTVYAALKAVIDTGKAIFARAACGPQSPPAPPTEEANAATGGAEETKQCLFGRVTKPGKNRGRPESVYLMPSIDDLCAWLNVRNQGGDTLQREDLAGGRAYRAALHVALIRRAPGQYPRVWQAARLGISEESCRRYEREAGIIVQPVYCAQFEVNWRTLERVAPDEPMMGHFLQDEGGKRYPPLRALAARLLALGRRLIYYTQDANHYTLPPIAQGDEIGTAPEPRAAPPIFKMFWRRTDSPAPGDPPRSSKSVDPAPSASSSWTIPKATFAPSRSAQSEGRSVGAESSADRLYDLLRSINPARSITRALALELVSIYGDRQVDRAIQTLQNRAGIHNPAGFIQTYLRSTSRARYPNPTALPGQGRGTSEGRIGASIHTLSIAAGGKGISQPVETDWLGKMAASEYLDFIDNADDIRRAIAAREGGG
jgi:hypothetical protein